MDSFFPKRRHRPLQLSHAVRLTPPDPLDNDRNTSENSLVALATEIQSLRDRMESMDRQHTSEVSELLRQNKHLQQHIRMIQEQLEKSRQYSVLCEKQQDRQQDLEKHVQNLESQIKRREQRELMLIQQNQSLSIQLEHLETKPCNNCQDRIKTQGLLRAQCASYKQEIALMNGTIKALKIEKQTLERDIDLLMEIKKSY